MATQTGPGILVNFKVESVEGTAATGGGSTGERLRILDSPGLKLDRGLIQSAERRNDGNPGKPRMGGKSVGGSYNVELSQGSFDTLIEGLLRSTWVAADPAITCDNGAAFTSIAITNQNTITLTGTGSFLTEGFRVGDVIRLSDMSTAANNSVNGVIKTVSASVIVVHGTPYTNQSSDSACTLTIQKKICQALTPTRRTFTVEQYHEDADISEQFVGVRVVSLELQLQPNGMVNATFGFVGMNRTWLATGSSPYFTSPTEYTSIALTAADASIYYNGSAIATLTGGSITFTIAAEVGAVIGSTTPVGTFDGMMTTTGDLVGSFTDASDHTLWDAETEFEVNLLLVEPDASAPVNFIHFFFPAAKILDIAKPLGGDGLMPQQRRLAFTPKVAAAGYDAGVVTVSTG
jgi:hypothetical protein